MICYEDCDGRLTVYINFKYAEAAQISCPKCNYIGRHAQPSVSYMSESNALFWMSARLPLYLGFRLISD